jgi:hypothetical protein
MADARLGLGGRGGAAGRNSRRPDATALAYAPIVLVGTPFGWPPVNYFEVALPWTVVHQIICCAGGFLWAATRLTHLHSLRHACRFCGRREMIDKAGEPGYAGAERPMVGENPADAA